MPIEPYIKIKNIDATSVYAKTWTSQPAMPFFQGLVVWISANLWHAPVQMHH